MTPQFRFNRLELAGSFGDLGTLLPLAMGMIMINGLSAVGIFVSVGLLYILSGLYYGVTVSVQPMKVISAYAIATALNAEQIAASGLIMGGMLLLIGMTNAITLVGKYVSKSVIRGVQISTGTLLMVQGLKFILGTSTYQNLLKVSEPYLSVQTIWSLPVGIYIGVSAALITLFFLENRTAPAGILVIGFGLLIGLVIGTGEGFDTFMPGLYLPEFLPFGFPSENDLSFALLVLVLPQLPMTLGNAVIANADLSKNYFHEYSDKVTYRALCFSMGLANMVAFLIGGMPLCHGAGGLAAHYRFGAKTAGSNLMIGALFIGLGIFLGPHVVTFMNLIPFSVLGVLLVFAGGQLALTILDINTRKEMFVCFIMLGITLMSSLAVGFGIGIALAWALTWDRLQV